MPKTLSTPTQLQDIAKILTDYLKLPFSTNTIPGKLMEAVLATVRDATVLDTYDFVDVIKSDSKIGWQVKSTKSTTPLTWKRAKIANAKALIEASHVSEEGLQALGDAIIDFCNAHILESLHKYNLDEIGYARLMVFASGQIAYYERVLVTANQPILFNKADYTWKWSNQKNTTKKEQLPALHGFDKTHDIKAFAWHGKGENQLHFTGEKLWHPDFSLRQGEHHIVFDFPGDNDKISLERLAELLKDL